ncbi:MAG: YicC/YloC family endoribonuclease, partial [Pseudomonadota bacterium]
MKLSSMTGFGRQSGDTDWGSWVWEVKSVNGRGFDIRLSVPSGFEALERDVKKLAQAKFKRGNLQMSLRIKPAQAAAQMQINAASLDQLARGFEAQFGSKPDANAFAVLMTIKGVVDRDASDPTIAVDTDGVGDMLLEGANSALSELENDRRREGASLGEVLASQLEEMQNLIRSARNDASQQLVAIRERYRARMSELDADGLVSEDRLATEIAVLAAKADVSEEIDRLEAHLEQLSGLLASD